MLRAAQWHSSDSAGGAKDGKDVKDVKAKVPGTGSFLKREESFQTKTVISIAHACAHSSNFAKFIPEEGDDLQRVTRLAALAPFSPRRFGHCRDELNARTRWLARALSLSARSRDAEALQFLQKCRAPDEPGA